MDWQSRYELGDTPWDKGAAAPTLLQLKEEKPFLFEAGREIFVPGCGAGHDAKRIADFGASVTATDIAPLAIECARMQYGSGVDFQQIDIFQTPFEWEGRFDVIWEHTCFCALEPSMRVRYVESMWKLLKANGLLVGVFFAAADEDTEDGPPYLMKRDSVCDVFASHFSLEWECAPIDSFEGREGSERILLFRRRTDI